MKIHIKVRRQNQNKHAFRALAFRRQTLLTVPRARVRPKSITKFSSSANAFRRSSASSTAKPNQTSANNFQYGFLLGKFIPSDVTPACKADLSGVYLSIFFISSLQPFLCQTFYTLIEYGKTTMFLWMFIEGIILHHMTTVAYSRGPDNQLTFYLCGWRKKNYEYQILSMTCTIGGTIKPVVGTLSSNYILVHP